MLEINARDYATRGELEKFVASKYGLTTETKDAAIVGTAAELAPLQLGSGSVFWGIACAVTDAAPPPKAKTADRGPKKPHGINKTK